MAREGVTFQLNQRVSHRYCSAHTAFTRAQASIQNLASSSVSSACGPQPFGSKNSSNGSKPRSGSRSMSRCSHTLNARPLAYASSAQGQVQWTVGLDVRVVSIAEEEENHRMVLAFESELEC